jgi:hypothetical protein
VTFLAALPLAAPVFRLNAGEDWLDAVAYADRNGAPLPLDGIAFALSLIPRGGSAVALTASTRAGTILVAGNVLSLNVPAGALADVDPGAYYVLMTGAADGRSRVLFKGRLAMGAPS